MFDFFSPIDAIRRISPLKAGKNIEESYGYLLNDFSSVAKLLGEYYPLELMKLSLWDERKVLSEKSRDSVKKEAAVLLPVLLQSVLSSSHFSSSGNERNVSDRDWMRLKSLSEDVTRRIIRLIENRTALASGEENFSDEDAENYRNIITEYLLPSAVTRETLHRDSVILRSLLEENVSLEEKTGVDYLTLSLNIDNIARKGLSGIDDLCQRVQAYRDDYDLALAKRKDQIEGKTEEEVYRMITRSNGWEGRAENLARERDGFDMFMLSSLSDLDKSVYRVFTADPGSLDIMSFMKMGYWPSLRFPFFRWKGEEYTFVARHIPLYIALTSPFNRRRAAMHEVLAIFYHAGVDTYSYDGNNIDISVLPSFYDRNLFTDQKAYDAVRKTREEERSLKAVYGHKRLIVDPDQKEERRNENDVLVISSAFMAEAAVDRIKKKELLSSLLGILELPEERSEYSIVDEDELDRTDSSQIDVVDDSVSDEFEYDSADEDEEARKLDERDESVEFVEYEKKDSVDIQKEEEKYALTDEILRKDEEIEKEEEKYESELDDDIFDDSEEEERLDEIGEKEESDYYEEIEEEPVKEEFEIDSGEEKDDDENDGQLDFFAILDEEEEKSFDDELEKEDEEEFREEEKKAENLEPEQPTLEDKIAEEIEEEEISSSEEAENLQSDETPEEDNEALSEEDGEESSLEDEMSSPEPDQPLLDDESAETENLQSDETPEEDNEALSEESSLEDEMSSPEPDQPLAEDESAETENEESGNEGDENLQTDEISEESNGEEKAGEDEPPLEDAGQPLLGDESEPENEAQAADTETKEGEPEKREDKQLDVKSWMNDFLGLNDIMDEETGNEEEEARAAVFSPSYDDISDDEENEMPPDEANLDDDSFVLPRIGMIDEKEGAGDAPEEMKEPEGETSAVPGNENDPEEKENTPFSSEQTSVSNAFPVSLEESEVLHADENHVDETEEEGEKQVLSMEELDDADEPVPLMTAEEAEEEDTIAFSGIVSDIYRKLVLSGDVFRSFVKAADDETLEELENVIHGCWSRMQEEQKDKLFNVPDYSFSLLLSHDSKHDDLRMSELLNNVGGVMYAREKEQWTAVIVYIDSSYSLETAIEKTLTKESFSPSDWKRVTYIGEQMRKR